MVPSCCDDLNPDAELEKTLFLNRLKCFIHFIVDFG